MDPIDNHPSYLDGAVRAWERAARGAAVSLADRADDQALRPARTDGIGIVAATITPQATRSGTARLPKKLAKISIERTTDGVLANLDYDMHRCGDGRIAFDVGDFAAA